MCVPIGLVSIEIGTHLNTVESIKTTPWSGGTLPGRLTSNVMETNAMAKPQCNQTHPKFQYRFLAISRSDRNAKPCRMSVEAPTEREARQVLAPHFILSLAARLPVQSITEIVIVEGVAEIAIPSKGVRETMTPAKGVTEMVIPSTIGKTSTVQEVRHA
ncbi:host cell division inhibitor Icd-like protein [Serratia fonticola]|uniref:Host cell division inhibitor Icd-like protein n=1 Tax=Serratia fonticola TaxID=47917 RepID=A0AAJ1YCQ3_SERFO|nr:host cell division inhibitor Icd-like protein [Serratia fonticola]MDQ9127649.1 host cell division inhibitor Icd-like protein [Serratia fonticola]